MRLNFSALPEPFREPVKHYVWQLINHDAPRRLRDTDAARLALRSIVLLVPRFSAFVLWLDSHGISRFADVTADHLDHYLADVVACEASTNMKTSRLLEVRRFWSYRSRLPEPMRLQVPPPWDGEEPRDLVDAPRRSAYNRTPRIQTDTIDMLLMWSLRFVESFADDITNAFHEHLELWRYSAVVCDPKFPSPKRRSAKDIRPELIDYLDHLRMTGGSLPGRLDSGGKMQIYWTHLVRLFKAREVVFKVDQHLRTLVEESGLPISDQLPLVAPITATIGEKPWLTGPIRYSEARHMARRLRTACFVVIAYLSGMRTGVKRAKLSTRQCFPNLAGAEPRQKIECCPAARRSIVADAVTADSVLASAGVRQRHLPTTPDRVTGAEPTSDDTAAGVCRWSSSGRPGVCSSCAPTANVATSIFRPRRRRR